MYQLSEFKWEEVEKSLSEFELFSFSLNEELLKNEDKNKTNINELRKNVKKEKLRPSFEKSSLISTNWKQVKQPCRESLISFLLEVYRLEMIGEGWGERGGGWIFYLAQKYIHLKKKKRKQSRMCAIVYCVTN